MSDELVDAPAKFKSPVWEYFGFPKKKDGDRWVANETLTVCKICKHEIKYACKNTSNMAIHLRRKHKIETSKVQAATELSNTSKQSLSSSTSSSQFREKRDVKSEAQPSIAKAFQSPLSAGSSRAKQITRQITLLLASDMRPFTLVDSKAFKELLHSLEPRYHLPSRVTFSQKEIPSLFSEVQHSVKEMLKNSQTVALTTDGWTSRSTESYITITAHYIDENWILQSSVLQTRPLFESHTGSNIAEVLRRAVEEWDLKRPHGIQPVTSDSAANMCVATREANMTPHVKCFAHAINLAAQHALKVNEVQRLLGRIRRIVTFFHKSSTATQLLKLKQNLLQLPNHKLLTEVKTRWNSAYDMIERYMEQQPAVMAVLMSQEIRKEDTDTLSAADITAAEHLLAVLKPLKTVTTILCEESEPTVSMIMPLMTTLKSGLAPSTHDSKLISQVKEAAMKDLAKRYQDTEIREFLLQATALDPRFKKMPFIETDEKLRVYASLVTLTDTVYNSVKQICVKQEPGASDQSRPDQNVNAPQLPEPPFPMKTETKEPPAKRQCVSQLSALDTLFGDVYVSKSEPPTKSQQELIEEELERYKYIEPATLAQPVLAWWKENQFNFPYLCHSARHLLCIPATSVPSERVFSTAGDVVTAQRSALSPEHVDMLIFLKKNMKFC